MSDQSQCTVCGGDVNPESGLCLECGVKQRIQLTFDDGWASPTRSEPLVPSAQPQAPVVDQHSSPAPSWSSPPISAVEPDTPVRVTSDIGEGAMILIGVCAVAAAIGAWFAENAAIHAAGYTGFGGAGWFTAVIIPVGAGCWVGGKLYELLAPS